MPPGNVILQEIRPPRHYVEGGAPFGHDRTPLVYLADWRKLGLRQPKVQGMTEFMDAQQLTDAIEAKLRRAGLRPTRQRLDLARLLFREGDRHVTAEMLHAEAASRDISVSLATVYNTLHQFTECGLLREVAIEGSKAYFDTNISDHQHFYFESDGRLIDLNGGELAFVTIPKVPEGTEISRVDVLIRLVEKPKRKP
jgi:Fur family transcriptional regulator, iron response regulator